MYPLAVLIPIMALAIPLVAVIGRVIVQPLAAALSARSAPAAAAPDRVLLARVRELEERVALLEPPVQTLLEEHEFRKQLEAPPR